MTLQQADGRSAGGFVSIARPQTFRAITAQFHERILSGDLRPGDRLPGERQLSEQFGVGRTSVREALRALEAQGLVSIRAGSGREAGVRITHEPGTALAELLRLHIALAHFRVDDVVAVRCSLEATAATKAAGSAQPDTLRQLRRLLDSMDDSTLTRERFHDLDTEFHLTICQAAGNELVLHLMQSIRSAIQHHMLRAFCAVPAWPDVAARLRREHRAILAAIEDGDPERAADAVRAHINRFYRSTVATVPDPDELT